MGTLEDKLRVNPRKAWYSNVKEVTTKGDYEVTFHLNRPQPALLAAVGIRLVADLPVSHTGAKCASIRSAPVRSNSSSSSPTST
jgi:MarR-like DNA-binding transcriptional regulator SgrR of sgrS sRNA